MNDPILRRVVELERQVNDLHQRASMRSAEMRGGGFRVTDEEGNVRVELGTLSNWGNGAGDYGFAVLTPEGRPVSIVNQDGQFVPYTSMAFTTLYGLDQFGFATRDTTTFEDFFRSDAWVTAPIFRYDLQIETGSAASVQWEITTAVYGGGPTQTVIASGSVAVDSQQAGVVDLRSVLGSDVVGRGFIFRFRAKRTGGSGAIGLRHNAPPLLYMP